MESFRGSFNVISSLAESGVKIVISANEFLFFQYIRDEAEYVQ